MKTLCPCSTRAFEVFVAEVTGVSLRQCPRYNQTPTLQVRRTKVGSTFISRRSVSSAVTVSGGAPLLRQKSGELTNASTKFVKEDGVTESWRALHETSKDSVGSEQHAEVEKAKPWQLEADGTGAGSAGSQSDEPAIQEINPQTQLVDRTALLSVQFENSSVEHTTDTPTSEPDPPSHSNAPAPAGSRAESRLQRKLRRIESGQYNRLGPKPRPERELRDVQTKAILDFMKASSADNEEVAVDPRTERQRANAGTRRVAAHPSEERAAKKETSTGANAGFKKPMRVDKDGNQQRAVAIAKDGNQQKAAAITKDLASQSATAPRKRGNEPWQIQKNALRDKFGAEGWQPRKRLSPDTLEGIRALYASDPGSYTTPVLAEHFKVTPEAIRRILRSKWRPNEEEIDDRRNRWEKRGERKWEAMAAQGVRPPAKWRAKGIQTPQVERERRAKRMAKRLGDAHVRWDDRSFADVGASLASRIA